MTVLQHFYQLKALSPGTGNNMKADQMIDSTSRRSLQFSKCVCLTPLVPIPHPESDFLESESRAHLLHVLVDAPGPQESTHEHDFDVYDCWAGTGCGLFISLVTCTILKALSCHRVSAIASPAHVNKSPVRGRDPLPTLGNDQQRARIVLLMSAEGQKEI